LSEPADPRHAVLNVKARYCAAADLAASDPHAARAEFMRVFAADVIADYGFGQLSGVEATAEFMCSSIPGNSEWMIHMLSTPLVEVTGERATGEWTVLVHAKRRDDGAIDVVRGRYQDAFRRDETDGQWRIERVQFRQLS
jgi:hypothetical protein